VALATAAAVPALAGARASSAGPQPRLMALTQQDVGHVATIDEEGSTTKGPIAASRGYHRWFSGLTPGRVQLLSIENTVLVGRSPSAAAKLVSSILASSPARLGSDKRYVDTARAFVESVQSGVSGGTVVRSGPVKAGDSAAEIVFRFDTVSGAFQVGQIFVRVGGNLSTIYYGGVMPGLSIQTARRIAVVAGERLREGSRTV
jgi:hypothetical protein